MAKPSDYFGTLIYQSNGSIDISPTGLAFTPDLVWTKSRAQAYNHQLYDTSRGVGNYILSNSDQAQAYGANTLKSFNAGGMTLGTSENTNFGSGNNAVAWCWKEDPAAGFDKVLYNGTGAAHAIDHDLAAVVEFMMVKLITGGSAHWQCYHHLMNANPQNGSLSLNQSWAYSADSSIWNNTAPTSTQFTVGTSAGVNLNGGSHIAYLWRSVKGFSKFGSYIGNGTSNGPFIETDFLPGLVMIKAADGGGGSWVMRDNVRDTYNPSIRELFPNNSLAEYNQPRAIDFTANGFKIRDSETIHNGSGTTYVYAAWAAQPFKYGRAH
jgi:hypothetical protein